MIQQAVAPVAKTLLLQKNKNISAIFILLEVVFGCIGGIVYINRLGTSEDSLQDSILNFYMVLNGIFLGVTILFGFVNAIYLKRTSRLVVAVLLSIATGLVFFTLHALLFAIPLFAFFSLFGFISGESLPS